MSQSGSSTWCWPLDKRVFASPRSHSAPSRWRERQDAAGLGALHAARGASAPVFSVSYQAKAADGAMHMFNRNEDMHPRGDKGKSVHSRSIRDRKNMEAMLRAINKRLGKIWDCSAIEGSGLPTPKNITLREEARRKREPSSTFSPSPLSQATLSPHPSTDSHSTSSNSPSPVQVSLLLTI